MTKLKMKAAAWMTRAEMTTSTPPNISFTNGNGIGFKEEKATTPPQRKSSAILTALGLGGESAAAKEEEEEREEEDAKATSGF